MIRKTTGRRAADQVGSRYEQIISEQLIKKLGAEFKVEDLRGRLVRVQHGDNEVLILDGEKFIEFFPLRLTTEHRNNTHFLKAELPYRTFEWELPA